MDFLIAGSGAVGCYFGARLQLGGHRVSFLARGERRAALEQHGLRIATDHVSHSLPVTFADDIQDWDVVLLAVKSWQVKAAVAALPLAPSWQGMILTTQNGVEAPDHVAALLGKDRLLAGIVHGFFEIDDDAQVRHVGVDPKLIFNALDLSASKAAMQLRDVVSGAGIVCGMPDNNIMTALWEKHMLSSALGGIGAYTGLPVGKTRTDPGLRGMTEAAMREVASVAYANGITLSADVIDRNMAFIDRFPADATTSMHRDIVTGRPSEFDAQTGAVIRFAELKGVAVPVNRSIYDKLAPLEQRARND